MKRITRTAVALALCCSLVAPNAVLASELDDFWPEDAATSETNSHEPWWRTTKQGDSTVGWGNKDLVDVKIANGSALSEDSPIGFLYDLTRTASSRIDTRTPGIYGRTIQPTGTHFSQLFNVPLYPGAVAGTEGIWFMNFHFFSRKTYAAEQRQIAIGIDKGKPRAVNGLAAYAGTHPSSPPLTGVSSTDRLTFRWSDEEYDDRSGTAYYQLYLNGEPWDTFQEDSPETDMAPGRVFRLPHVPAAITVENFPPGKHVVGISAVDRATNEGPRTEIEVVVDLEPPTVSLLAPVAGEVINARPQVSAEATDDAGIAHVRFFLGSALIGQATSEPYAIQPNLSAYADGKYTLTAVAEDLFGRQVSSSPVEVHLDKAAPTMPTIVPLDVDGVVSSTNPFASLWRTTVDRFGLLVAWGNKDLIDMKLSKADAAGSEATGFLYDVTRIPSLIDTSRPGDYGTTIQASGTHFDEFLNIPRYVTSGDTQGVWYANLHFFGASGFDDNQRILAFGIDKKAPSAVAGFKAFEGTGPLAPEVTGPLATDRVHFRWNDEEYDDRSGTAYYQLYLNGEHWNGGDAGRVYRGSPAAVTFESLPPGKHVVGISAVDRATNEGARRNIEVIVDTDVPTISLTAPKSGSFIGARPTFTANATDKAGIKHVRFYVNNKLVATDTTRPYSVKPDLSGFAAGKVTITAMVEDLYGRQVVTSNLTVTLDKVAPSMTKISDAPDPFYPRKREGYKDDSIIKFTLSEAVKVKVDIFNSKGKIVRTINTTRKAGATSVKWDGKKSDGKLADAGTYRYRITATDAAGNSSASSRYPTTLAYVEFVRVSPSMVRVIQR